MAEAFGELVGGLALNLAAVGLLLVVADLTRRGWQRHPVATVAAVAAFLGLAAYGFVLIVRDTGRRGVVAAMAIGAAVLVVAWVSVLVMAI